MGMVRRSGPALGAVAAVLLCGLVPALGQSADQCRADGPADEVVAACSALITGGRTGQALAEALAFRGVGWLRKNDLDRALADAEQAIRTDPSYARGYNVRGLVKVRKRDPDGAIADYGTAIKLDPNYAPAYYNRGLAWRGKGDVDRAIADYDGAIAADPKHLNAFLSRGLAWRLKGGQTDREIADYTSAIHIDPRSARAYDYRAWAWRAKRELDRAMDDVNQALMLDPNYAGAYNNRGLIWRAKGDVDKSIADFDITIRLDPRAAYALNNRGVAKRTKGDMAGALDDFSAALRVDPNYLATYTNRGLLHESRGETERARADFNTALSLPLKYDNGKWAQDTARARLALLTGAPAARQPGAPGPAPSSPPTPSAPATTAPAPAPAVASARVAAVIGNGAYQNANALPNPVNDARAVSRRLRDIGFTVSEGYDLDRNGLERVVRDFLRRAATAKIALLYYAGHGMQVDGKNYLVPVDAKLTAPSDLGFETLELDKILASLDDETRANILILDACRDNPLSRSFAGKSRSGAVGAGLAAYTTVGSGTLIAYATAPGRVALDGDGSNSPFTTALIKHMGTPGLEVRQMLTRVRAEVASATRNQQIPWDNSSLLGDVFLASAQKP